MTRSEILIKLVALAALAACVPAQEDWTNCAPCKCSWVNGRKKADCRRDKGVVLSTIPNNLSSEIRNVDFSHQQFYQLPKKAFSDVNLGDVQKIKLVDCSLQTVDRYAFANLLLLIELNMSGNEIEKLDPELFRDNVGLRVLQLDNNKIERLDDGIFANMKNLQKVILSSNRISHIGKLVFLNKDYLQNIMLDNNRLSYLDTKIFADLGRLSSLSLHNNPWKCDCHLRQFRNLAIGKNLFTSYVECSEPERLKGQHWMNLKSEDFACLPRILVPSGASSSIHADTDNITMACQVMGEPRPEVNWVFRHGIVDANPRRPGGQRYSIGTSILGSGAESTYWVNLTIIGVNFHDGGVYRCTAKNPGGIDERNITLLLSGRYGTIDHNGVLGPGTALNDPLALVLCVVLVIVVLALIVTLVLWYCVCRRRNMRHSKGESLSPNGDICMEGTTSEMEKSLITEVNPVVKPPRQYSVPPSVASGVTEVSEVNRTLLDNDSVFAAGDDDSRSFDFLEPTPRKSQNYLDMENTRLERPYPPDLLSFPARGYQISPAVSLASTIPDHSRLPPQHGPQSPINSPLYDVPGIYRTLPYSRSHSPFTPAQSRLVVTPRSGYITIPRRPRVPSWSSAPPSTPLVAEPVYDNLGLRTTAEGNSILSLNKAGEGTGQPCAPMTPVQVIQHQSPNMCTPIKELDKTSEHANTLPTQRSLQNLLLSPEVKRDSWARMMPEGQNLQTVDIDARRLSNASVVSIPDGSSKKLPPKPPPKPKKSVHTGPLFEDEGEDGTEV